ncbi:MAG: hypothetical protein WAM03_13500 [Pseudolabrys sp.]
MPQVASDPKIHSHGHTTPRQSRPAQQADRAASPFESLLDDGASPPAGNPAQNKAAPVEESRSPSKTDECKSPSANDRTTTKKADETDCVGADAEDGAPSDGIKVTPGPVLVEDASGTENSEPRGEEKQATASDPGDPTAVQTAIDQKIPSADAFAGPAADSRIASRAIPRSRPPDFADC